jgi:hypothetical protein
LLVAYNAGHCRPQKQYEQHFYLLFKKDKTIAVKLKQRLQTEGWSVFMDEHIDTDHPWSEEIKTQFAEA